MVFHRAEDTTCIDQTNAPVKSDRTKANGSNLFSPTTLYHGTGNTQR